MQGRQSLGDLFYESAWSYSLSRYNSCWDDYYLLSIINNHNGNYIVVVSLTLEWDANNKKLKMSVCGTWHRGRTPSPHPHWLVAVWATQRASAACVGPCSHTTWPCTLPSLWWSQQSLVTGLTSWQAGEHPPIDSWSEQVTDQSYK